MAVRADAVAGGSRGRGLGASAAAAVCEADTFGEAGPAVDDALVAVVDDVVDDTAIGLDGDGGEVMIPVAVVVVAVPGRDRETDGMTTADAPAVAGRNSRRV